METEIVWKIMESVDAMKEMFWDVIQTVTLAGQNDNQHPVHL